MRELIYLSDPKIRQFVDTKPASRWHSVLKKLSGHIKVPLVAGSLEVTFDTLSASTPSFENVYEGILNRAQWYEDDCIESGNWILFETKMRYRVGQPDGDTSPVVVFFECVRPGATAGRRLILHGSARNLKGYKLQANKAKRDMNASSPDEFLKVLNIFSRPSDRLLLTQSHAEDRVVSKFLAQHAQPVDYLRAATMSGCARVSAVFQGGGVNALSASPLFVQNGPEYSHLVSYSRQG